MKKNTKKLIEQMRFGSSISQITNYIIDYYD